MNKLFGHFLPNCYDLRMPHTEPLKYQRNIETMMFIVSSCFMVANLSTP